MTGQEDQRPAKAGIRRQHPQGSGDGRTEGGGFRDFRPCPAPGLHEAGEEYPAKHDLSSLRLAGWPASRSNPRAWLWYHAVVGGERCPVVDTWWQTETGAIMITPLPGLTAAKPGSAGLPLPAVSAALLDESGKPAEQGSGLLALTRPWPSMLRTLYDDPERYVRTYFGRVGPRTYFAGDGARGAWPDTISAGPSSWPRRDQRRYR